ARHCSWPARSPRRRGCRSDDLWRGGPALRQPDPIRLRPGRDLEHPKGLCATAHGFSLHAATTAKDAAPSELRVVIHQVRGKEAKPDEIEPPSAPAENY